MHVRNLRLRTTHLGDLRPSVLMPDNRYIPLNCLECLFLDSIVTAASHISKVVLKILSLQLMATSSHLEWRR